MHARSMLSHAAHTLRHACLHWPSASSPPFSTVSPATFQLWGVEVTVSFKLAGAAPNLKPGPPRQAGPGGPGGRCVTVTVTVTTNVTVLLMNVLLVCSLW